MFKSVLRLAGASLLMSAAMIANAAPVSQDLVVTGVFQETIVPSLTCSSGLSGNLAGYGNGTGLGRIVFLSSDCFKIDGPVFTFSNGKFMITTATGELLFANYSGQVVTNDGVNGVMTGATFQITGGTGRYKDARGGGALDGTEDLPTGKGTLKLTGKLLLKK